jgi:hypothetical protein
MMDATSRIQLADADREIQETPARVRRAGWDVWALPASIAFAVLAVLLLRFPFSFAPITTAAAADPMQPDYVMTITAKRLPLECRGSRSASCTSYLEGDATIQVRENGSGSRN